MKKLAFLLLAMLISVMTFAQGTPKQVPNSNTIIWFSYPAGTSFLLQSTGINYQAITTTKADTTFSALINMGEVAPSFVAGLNFTEITIPLASLDSLHMVSGDTLLPSPGSGKFIDLIHMDVQITANTSGAWSIASQTGNVGWGAVTAYRYAIPNADLTNASGTIESQPAGTACKPVLNSPLVWKLSAGTKPANSYKPTLKFLLYYYIVTP
jgi:hypothetical protein